MNAMIEKKGILFDVDGVLLDSLGPHLRICEDKNKEYGLNLKIPNAVELKQMARNGVRISPMEFFFQAVGFSQEYAEKATRQYQDIFMRFYRPVPFKGVDATLKTLHGSGLQMGIVTSNVRANVVEALGQSIKYFDQGCIYTKDNMEGLSKAEAIVSAIRHFNIEREETLFVGDQPSDYSAATEAKVDFLGVTYGWGISVKDNEFPHINEISEICDYLYSCQGKKIK